jgi:hypothetical protein
MIGTAAIPITALSAKLINWNKNNRATTSHEAFRSFAGMASTWAVLRRLS